MNSDSLPLCEGILKKGGVMVINTSLVKDRPGREDINTVSLEAQSIAEQIGNPKIANMVALGAMAKVSGALALTGIEAILKNFFPDDKHGFIPMNVEAIRAGYEAV
jgi:2-oxoglutarate ferredoxin oxidoreductase subunit gamma